jgi:hypothetical protein
VKCTIRDQVVLLRAPEGPLVTHIGPFVQSQSAQGYAQSWIHQQVLLAAGFSHWLQQRGVALGHVNSRSSLAVFGLSRSMFTASRRRCRCTQASPRFSSPQGRDCRREDRRSSTDKISSVQACQYARYRGGVALDLAAAVPTVANLPRRAELGIAGEASRAFASTAREAIDHCLAFLPALSDVRAVAPATILVYVPLVRGFLSDRFGAGVEKRPDLQHGIGIFTIPQQIWGIV